MRAYRLRWGHARSGRTAATEATGHGCRRGNATRRPAHRRDVPNGRPERWRRRSAGATGCQASVHERPARHDQPAGSKADATTAAGHGAATNGHARGWSSSTPAADPWRAARSAHTNVPTTSADGRPAAATTRSGAAATTAVRRPWRRQHDEPTADAVLPDAAAVPATATATKPAPTTHNVKEMKPGVYLCAPVERHLCRRPSRIFVGEEKRPNRDRAIN
ncbi:uncharacterized protein ACA1_264760 [Acanthamoeba castellanii str. Neff]|uniref:Uncharacterized protein n=1 Tax=Acanthamoeba castellanii (strain ATCC 30010 / Neff) TaxID=1257118 RepID=L8H256_ACACF|nr:uncharacterized protein ACA1_264760 [Acanthamoeba castellanii str. Neff]ELR19302.1 hypothetical protein ACA1_264760 [Acanthamoeba castellanii str. Neff]